MNEYKFDIDIIELMAERRIIMPFELMCQLSRLKIHKEIPDRLIELFDEIKQFKPLVVYKDKENDEDIDEGYVITTINYSGENCYFIFKKDKNGKYIRTEASKKNNLYQKNLFYRDFIKKLTTPV